MRLTLVPAIVAVGIAVGSSAAAETITVTDNGRSGPGTFRAAVDRANADAAIGRIAFRPGLGVVALAAPVAFTGIQALAIDGAGATITQDGAHDLFLAGGGGDLTLANIAFRGALRSAVAVHVPPGAALREQAVTLDNVVLADNGCTASISTTRRAATAAAPIPARAWGSSSSIAS